MDKKVETTETPKTVSRRKFLTTAAAVTTGAAITGFPSISVAASPIVLKMQGAWGAKDIFNDMAQEYVDRVNQMAEGRLRIDYLVAGSVVKPFEVMEATSKGVIDAGHLVWQKQGRLAVRFRSGHRLYRRPEPGLDRQGRVPLLQRTDEKTQSRRGRFFCNADADPAAGLVQEADQKRGSAERPEVPHRWTGCRPDAGTGLQGNPVAGRRDRAGDGARQLPTCGLAPRTLPRTT